MADPAPKTRDWSAHEGAHKPRGMHLLVNGLVEVNNTNLHPRLTESPERRINSLGLALTIEKTSDPGLDVKVWKAASFHREVQADEFDQVNIRWHFEEIATTPVIDDGEHHKHAAAQMKALNARHAGKAGPKAAAKAKPAAKKAKKVVKKAAKKKARKASAMSRAAKKVGGWAKGAKTALKKLTKKAPKKAKAKKAKKKGTP